MAAARAPKSPHPIEQFLSTHPAALKFVTTPRPAPVSFGTLAFYGINAFKFTNAKGAVKYDRYQMIPAADEAVLDAADAAKAANNYLMDEVLQRIAKSPVKFTLYATVAVEGDSTIDGTQIWPADRERMELGTLSLTKTPDEQVLAQKKLLFNPLSLTA